jgi:hypothetical protein
MLVDVAYPKVDREWLERELAMTWKNQGQRTALIPSAMSNEDREAVRNAAEHVYRLGFADGAFGIAAVRGQLAAAEKVIAGYGENEPPIVKGALDAQAQAETEMFALRRQLKERNEDVRRLTRCLEAVAELANAALASKPESPSHE